MRFHSEDHSANRVERSVIGPAGPWMRLGPVVCGATEVGKDTGASRPNARSWCGPTEVAGRRTHARSPASSTARQSPHIAGRISTRSVECRGLTCRMENQSACAVGLHGSRSICTRLVRSRYAVKIAPHMMTALGMRMACSSGSLKSSAPAHASAGMRKVSSAET